MEKYKQADKDVQDAEAKLASAEAAATAKRSEVKLTGVDDAVELLRQVATVQCGDETVAAQVATALQQIASLLGKATAATCPTPGMGDDTPADATGSQTSTGGQQPTVASRAEAQPVRHAVFAACGGNGNKSRRVDGPPIQQDPAAHAALPTDNGGDGGGGRQNEVYAGGSVDGEVQMGTDAATDESILSQAATLLGDGGDDL